jgi:hypothetical protein
VLGSLWASQHRDAPRASRVTPLMVSLSNHRQRPHASRLAPHTPHGELVEPSPATTSLPPLASSRAPAGQAPRASRLTPLMVSLSNHRQQATRPAPFSHAFAPHAPCPQRPGARRLSSSAWRWTAVRAGLALDGYPHGPGARSSPPGARRPGVRWFDKLTMRRIGLAVDCLSSAAWRSTPVLSGLAHDGSTSSP